MMHLQVLVPHETLIDQAVTQVIAESSQGSFCLLPAHIDWVADLVPGILSFTSGDGEETVLAVDEGLLVKQGSQVRVAVRRAMRGDRLETLRETVQQQFQRLDDQEKQARSVLARLESSFIRELSEFGGGNDGV